MVDMCALKQQGGSSENLPYQHLINVVELNSGFQSSEKSILSANAEVFGNNRLAIVDEIQGVRNNAYDFLILDLPSVIDDSSVSMLARFADQAILVIEAERVLNQVLKSVCERLTEAGVVIKGYT